MENNPFLVGEVSALQGVLVGDVALNPDSEEFNDRVGIKRSENADELVFPEYILLRLLEFPAGVWFSI